MNRKCANQPTTFTGVSSIDPNGDGIVQLANIIQDMKDFFQDAISGCKPSLSQNVGEKLDRWEVLLDAKFNHLNN